MIGDWTTEVRREYLGLDARFDFPVRRLGGLRVVGVLLAAFGVVFLWAPAWGLWGVIESLLRDAPTGSDLLSALLHVPFVLGGCVSLAIGVFVLAGRARVEWRDGRLQVMELAGPLRWRRRFARRRILRFTVVGAPSHGSGVAASGVLASLAALFAEIEGGPRRVVVMGYPKTWLLSLADELGALAGVCGPTAVEIVDGWQAAAEPDEVETQPAESEVQIEEGRESVRMMVPPAGLWKGSRGLFVFGLIWCVFIGIFTVALASASHGGSKVEWLPILFIGVFWAVGIGLLLAGINMGRRSALLVVQGGRLQVVARGLFQTRRWEWDGVEVSHICVGPSGMEVNNRPVNELQVHPREGNKVGLMAGRQDDELRWMASRLRHALSVPGRSERVLSDGLGGATEGRRDAR